LAKAEWLERRQAELLPVEYFHLVFTLPHELNLLTLSNKKLMLNLLFKVVAETLEAFAANPQHGLGGKIGFTAVLHTWNQRLLDHFHLHCVVPGGVLSFDGHRFLRAKRGYLFPVEALSQVFRGKYIDWLKKLYVNGRIVIEPDKEHVEVIGQPVPLDQAVPVSREEQAANLKEFMDTIVAAMNKQRKQSAGGKDLPPARGFVVMIGRKPENE
jgi:hypothetical protein